MMNGCMHKHIHKMSHNLPVFCQQDIERAINHSICLLLYDAEFVAQHSLQKPITRALEQCRPLPRNLTISKWKNPDYYLYPDSDPDHSQNLMGSKLDQDLSSDFFMKFQPVAFA